MRIFRKEGQISFEYLIIMGFVTFILVGLLAFSAVYGQEVQDKLSMTHVENYGNKIISTAESVFYMGEPSKITIDVHLPDGVKNVVVLNDGILVSIQTSTGINTRIFSSDVPLSGTLSSNYGLKKIELVASSGEVVISEP